MVNGIIRNKAISLLLISLVIFSCGPNNKSKENLSVSLRQEWFPFSGYAGEVCAVNETGPDNGILIKLNAGSDNIDPIKLVLGGQDDFGVISADRILLANEKGAELVVIGVINFKTPTCFITMKDQNILNPDDFVNKRVGILTGTNTELVYKILKSETGLSDKNIIEFEIPFDLATFISGQYDVRPAFIYDEPISLDLQSIEYNIIKPEDYNVSFLGTVYFTRKKMIEENPEKVKKFVFSMIEGWNSALKNPSKAIEYLKSYDDNIDVERELKSLNKGLEYFAGENDIILYASKEKWTAMAEQLITLNMLNNFDYEATVDYRFLNMYYQRDDL